MLVGTVDYLRSAAHKCREAADSTSSPYSPMIHQLADKLELMAGQQQGAHASFPLDCARR